MRKIIILTFYSGLLTLLRVLSALVIAKVVAVYAGPIGVAMLAQIHGFFTMINGVVVAPAPNGVVRYTTENHSNGFESCRPWWISTIKYITVMYGIISIVLIIFNKTIASIILGDVSYFWLFFLMVLVIPFSAASSIIVAVLNGLEKNRKYLLLSAIAIVINTSLVVVAVVESRLVGVMTSAILIFGISGVIMILGVFNEPWFKKKYWFGVADKKNITGVGGYAVMAIASAATMPVALIIIRNLMLDKFGWEKVGHWQAVYKISEVYLGVITVVLNLYLLPKLVSLDREIEIKKELKNITGAILPIVLVMAALVYFLRDVAINLVFTIEFKEARDFFATQLLGDVMKIIAWIYIYPMISYGKIKWYVITEFVFAFSFVVLSYYFMGRYGAIGVGYAYLVNSLICFLFHFINLKNILKNKI